MILEPYRTQPIDRPVGYVIDAETVVGEWAGNRWRNIPRKAALYVDNISTMRPMYHAGDVEAIYWKKRGHHRTLTSWRWFHPIDGHPHTIYYTKGTLARVPVEQRLAAILEYVTFVRFHGGGVSSPVGMIGGLMRTTLARPFMESSSNVPTDSVWRGSRVQRDNLTRSEYGPTDLWDMRAAFSSTLADLKVPFKWRRYEGDKYLPDQGENGYARARVHVPWFAGERGPLPDLSQPHATFPVNITLHGVWSFAELRAAEAVGCDIWLYESWTGNGFREPFKEWGGLVEELRSAVSLDARPLVKLAANRYIGRFAMSGNRERSRMVNGKEIWTAEKGHTRPQSLAIHGLVTGGVRADLFTDGIYPYPAHFVFCHTDGVALVADEYTESTRPPDDRWRVKAYMDRLLLINPQRYAYQPGVEDLDPGDWRYCIAGVPDEVAQGFFERKWLQLANWRADSYNVGNRREYGYGKRRGSQDPPTGTKGRRRTRATRLRD